MKAKLVDSMPPGNWIYEIKFDGYRGLALHGGNENPSPLPKRKGFGRQRPSKSQNLSIEERKVKLEELLKKPPGVIRFSVSFAKEFKELLARAQGLGLEGLIDKRMRFPLRSRETVRRLDQDQAAP